MKTTTTQQPQKTDCSKFNSNLLFTHTSLKFARACSLIQRRCVLFGKCVSLFAQLDDDSFERECVAICCCYCGCNSLYTLVKHATQRAIICAVLALCLIELRAQQHTCTQCECESTTGTTQRPRKLVGPVEWSVVVVGVCDTRRTHTTLLKPLFWIFARRLITYLTCGELANVLAALFCVDACARALLVRCEWVLIHSKRNACCRW